MTPKTNCYKGYRLDYTDLGDTGGILKRYKVVIWRSTSEGDMVADILYENNLAKLEHEAQAYVDFWG